MKRRNMNLFMATATAAVMVATIVAPVAPMAVEAASAKTFGDVPTTHTYYKEITEMTKLGIINGYESGLFKPNEKISRKHAAALLARAFPKAYAESPKTVANDVRASHGYYKDINLVVQAGFIKLDKNGNFNPNAEMTRGDMALALYKAYNLEKKGFNKNAANFSDVKDKTLMEVTSILYDSKITTGYENNTFKPNEGLSRAHYTVFMYRASKALKEQTSKPYNQSGTVEESKDTLSLLKGTYMGKYKEGKGPIPKAYNKESQKAEHERLQRLMPKGAFTGLGAVSNDDWGEIYINKLAENMGISKELVVKYSDEAATKGTFIFFSNTEGEKYYIAFKYDTHSIYYGEDHR